MATYVLGDIQGCFRTLNNLLRKINFSQRKDRLWLVGDLVNRGPGSLEVLRWAKELGPVVAVVLGNHDLHLLARALCKVPPKSFDTLDSVLHASDREELLAWLRGRPLLYRQGPFLMVHAGLAPSWTVEEAEALAREAEAVLQGPEGVELLTLLSGKDPVQWDPMLQGLERHRVVIKILTRMRICDQGGKCNFHFTGSASAIPDPFFPWYLVPGRESRGTTILCGHWSALGFVKQLGVISLDTGCVWGRNLTAYCLEDERVFQEPYAERV